MRHFIPFASLLIALSACNTITHQDGIIYFDTDKKYPVLNLSLSDIANIRYVKLEGEELNLIINEISSDICFDKTRNQIILGKTLKPPYFISVFDKDGHFLRQIGHQGSGPGEFLSEVNLAYQDKNDILTVFSRSNSKIIQYHSSGDYIRERCFSFIPPFSRIFLLDDRIIIYNYADNSVINNRLLDNGWTFKVLNINTLEEIPIKDHHFDETMNEDDPTIPREGTCITDDGLLFTSCRSDTTYLLDHNLEIHPVLIDIQHNRERGFLLVPTFETKDYLFLQLYPPRKAGIGQTGHKYYAIRRSDKAIFSCGTNTYYSIFTHNTLSLGNSIQSVTPGCGRYVIFKGYVPNPPEPDFPIPPEVEELAKDMDDESNPILMIIEFK